MIGFLGRASYVGIGQLAVTHGLGPQIFVQPMINAQPPLITSPCPGPLIDLVPLALYPWEEVEPEQPFVFCEKDPTRFVLDPRECEELPNNVFVFPMQKKGESTYAPTEPERQLLVAGSVVEKKEMVGYLLLAGAVGFGLAWYWRRKKG